MNPLVLTPARLSEAPAWIAESLAFLAEARQCLTKGDLPGKPTKLLGEIDALERDLQFLITIKRNGLEPLRARLRNNLLEQRQGRFAGNIYDEWLEWVRKLCAADMPALAEQLAAAPSFDEEVAAGLTNAPIPLIGYVGRHYLAHGNRAEGIRVLTEAAASSPMVRLDNAGGVAPGPLMLLAFPEPGDVDAAIAVSRGLKDPFVQSAALLAVARRSVEGGDRNKAQEVLREAEKVVESAAAALPAETRSMALVTPYLRLGRAYRDFDAKKSAQYADRALEAACMLRDRQVADSAARTAVEPMAAGGRAWSATMDALRQLACGFYSSGDRERGRAAFRLLLDAAAKGRPAKQAYEAARGVAMSAAGVGEYAAAAVILRDIQDDPLEDLCACVKDSKTPLTAAEAREFVVAYRNLPPSDDFASRIKMVRAMIMAGEVNGARKLADLYSYTVIDGGYLGALVAAELAAENKTSEAEKGLTVTEDRRTHDMAMILTADALLARGNLDGAVQYLDRARQSGAGVVTSDIPARVALACVKAGRIDDAVRIGSQSEARAALRAGAVPSRALERRAEDHR